MIITTLKHAMRTIRKQKIFSLISIIGLAVGMACSLMLFAYIQHEKSYDRFFEGLENIYRVLQNDATSTSFPLGKILQQNLPASAIFTRVEQSAGGLYAYKNNALNNIVSWYADNHFFDVFSFAFRQGVPKKALSEPNSIVLTETLANRLFGDEYPIGKTINTNNTEVYQVTGIIKDIPSHCHMQFDALVSWNSDFDNNDNWFHSSPSIYIKTLNNKISDIEASLNRVIEQYENKGCSKLDLQPITDIHLYSTITSDNNSVSIYAYIRLFAAIAILILLISCINIVNITTAQQLQRQAQIGVRKIFCANKKQLLWQFLTESFILNAGSFILAMLFVQMMTPMLQNILQIDFLTQTTKLEFIAFAFAILVGTTLLTGLYPAWLAIKADPLTILGKKSTGKQKYILRTVLVTTQFVITIGLLVTLGFMHDQLSYLNNKNLGFNQDNKFIIYRRWQCKFDHSDFKILANSLLQNPHILEMGHGSIPSAAGRCAVLSIQNKDTGKLMEFENMHVSMNFLEMMEFELVEGRFFSAEFPSDENAAVITETAVKTLGWENPIGKTIPGNKKVIGVIKDFNYFSLHDKQLPTFIMLIPEKTYISAIVVKLDGHADFTIVKDIEKTWNALRPDWPFEGTFLDARIDDFYRFELRLERLFLIFTILAIFLSCLGLLGITAIATEQRTKEIGIRIVNGASVHHIVSLFTQRIIISIIVAAVIVTPVVWYFVDKWLQNFAYKIELTIWPFLFAGLAALAIAMLTVSFQTIRAATANPVEALRYE